MKSITIKLSDDLRKIIENRTKENNTTIVHYVRSLIYKGLTLEQAIDYNPLIKRIGEMVTENLILSRELIELNFKDKESALGILVNAENRGRNYIKGREYGTTSSSEKQ